MSPAAIGVMTMVGLVTLIVGLELRKKYYYSSKGTLTAGFGLALLLGGVYMMLSTQLQ